MRLTRDQGNRLAYAADRWSWPAHEITLVCGSCEATISIGYVFLTPNWDALVGWDEEDAAVWTRDPGENHAGYQRIACPSCGASWTVSAPDQLRAALLALGAPTFEHRVRLHTKRARLTIGEDFPRPDEETVAFIDGLPPAPAPAE